MIISRKTLPTLTLLMTGLAAAPLIAQIELPRTASNARKETAVETSNVVAAPIFLYANLRARILTVKQDDNVIRTYAVAIGQPKYPTPPGSYTIRKIVWNPRWTPPPDAVWAKGKTGK